MSDGESTEEVISLVILAKKPRDFKSVQTFLNKRGWKIFITDNIKEGMSLITDNKIQWALMSVNLANTNVERMPAFLMSNFNMQVIAFAEEGDAQTAYKLSIMKIPVMHGKPSGPGIQTKIKTILNGQQAKEQAARRSSGNWSDKDEDQNVRISSKGGDDGGAMVIKSSSAGGSDSQVFKSGENLADDVTRIKNAKLEGGDEVYDPDSPEAQLKKNELYIQKGVVGQKYNETQEGIAGSGTTNFHQSENEEAAETKYHDASPEEKAEKLKRAQEELDELNKESAQGPLIQEAPQMGETNFHDAESAQPTHENNSGGAVTHSPELQATAEATETVEPNDQQTADNAEEMTPAKEEAIAGETKIHSANSYEELRKKKPEDMTPQEYFYHCVYRGLVDLCVPRRPGFTKIKDTETIGVIAIQNEHMQGYLYLASSVGGRINQEYLSNLRGLITKYLAERSYKLTADRSGKVSIHIDNFPGWSKRFGEFFCHMGDGDGEVMITYVHDTPILPDVDYNTNQVDKASVKMKDITPDKQLPCDFFIYLPKNKKYVRYLKKDGMVSAEQKERFEKNESSSLMIHTDDVKAFELFYIQKKIDDALSRTQDQTDEEEKKAS